MLTYFPYREPVEELDMLPQPKVCVRSWKHTRITPGITREEYELRRGRLMRILVMTHSSIRCEKYIVILTAAPVKIMSNDVPYPYHQDTDFLYFTGIQEPNTAVIIENKLTKKTQQNSEQHVKIVRDIHYTIFVQSKNKKDNLWSGPTISKQAAIDFFGANESFTIPLLSKIFHSKYNLSDTCLWVKTNNNTRSTRNRNSLEFLGSLNCPPYKSIHI